MPLTDLIDRDRFEDWQKSLIYEQKHVSSDQLTAERNQEQLEVVVEAGPSSVRDYLLDKLGIADRREAETFVPSLPNPLTVAEMQNLTLHAERELGQSLGNIKPAEAANPAFWTLCHAIWIGAWMFDADIAAVFMEGARAGNSEQRTRNFLRRLGGLRRVRGNVSVLTDCPISAAWWRYRIARAASDVAQGRGSDLSVEKAHQVLRKSQIWENWAGWSLKRVTSLNAPAAQAAVIVALAHQDTANNGVSDKQKVQGALRAVAQAAHNHSLHSIKWDQLLGIAAEGLVYAPAEETEEDEG